MVWIENVHVTRIIIPSYKKVMKIICQKSEIVPAIISLLSLNGWLIQKFKKIDKFSHVLMVIVKVLFTRSIKRILKLENEKIRVPFAYFSKRI